MKRLICIALMASAMTICSCDTPETMAWNHYHFAKSLFEEGEFERALEYLESAADDNNSTANKRKSKELAAKIVELQEEIEKAMQSNDSVQSDKENK